MDLNGSFVVIMNRSYLKFFLLIIIQLWRLENFTSNSRVWAFRLLDFKGRLSFLQRSSHSFEQHVLFPRRGVSPQAQKFETTWRLLNLGRNFFIYLHSLRSGEEDLLTRSCFSLLKQITLGKKKDGDQGCSSNGTKRPLPGSLLLNDLKGEVTTWLVGMKESL